MLDFDAREVRTPLSTRLGRHWVVAIVFATGLVGHFRASEAANLEGSVKVGILHSQTGTMAISERSLHEVELMAIEEINASGGLLGKKLIPVVEDPASRNETFAEKAKKLLEGDKVAVIFGCWTSASRKSVLPIVEKSNGLLFYPVQYEGNEASRNVVYTGAAPNQQILPAVDWLLSKEGGERKKFYLLGSDYVFPRTAHLIIKKYLATKSVKEVGEDYLPLGHADFAAAVEKIKAAAPDVILSTLNGDSNVYFFKQLQQQGLTADKLPVVSFSVGEDELQNLTPSQVKGHLAAWNYFQSIDTPANAAFIKRFREYTKQSDRITDDPIESAYTAVYLWKLAVEKANSFDVDKVRAAMIAGNIEFDSPGGKAKLDPRNLHTYKTFRMGRIRNDNQFEIVYGSKDTIAPDPYPQVAFPGWSCDWTAKGLVRGADVTIDK